MSHLEVWEIWQMGPLGYPFLYDTQLPNFPNFHFRRRQWMRLTASEVSDRFTSYPTYMEKRAGQWLATRVRPGKKNVSRLMTRAWDQPGSDLLTRQGSGTAESAARPRAKC